MECRSDEGPIEPRLFQCNEVVCVADASAGDDLGGEVALDPLAESHRGYPAAHSHLGQIEDDQRFDSFFNRFGAMARLSPVLAAGAMALSSVFVVGNALRLRRAGAAA